MSAVDCERHDLVHDRDYELTLLNNPKKPIRILDISRTFGALTAYEVWLYGIEFNLDQLCLSEIDRWISFDGMRKGITSTGKPISGPKFCRLFDACIRGGLECVLPLITMSKTKDYLDYILHNHECK